METAFNLGFSVFFGFFGLIMCVIGGFIRKSQTSMRSRMIRVTVRVTDLLASRSSDGGVTYAPMFEIVDGPHAGRSHMSTFYTKPAMHDVGDEVPGIFNPESGEIASLKSANLGNLISSILLAVGTGILGFGALGAFGLGPFG